MSCSDSGEFVYPTSWLQCSNTVFCPDPGNSSMVSREYSTLVTDLEYNSKLRYDDNNCDAKNDYFTSLLQIHV